MAAQVTVQWNGTPPCGASSPPYAGEEYRLYLNQELFTSDVTGGITGTFVSEGPGGPGYEKTYVFEIDESDIPDGVSELASCHIVDIACPDNCCSELLARVIAIESNRSTLSAVSNDGDDEITLTLTAAQQAAGFTTEHIVGTNFIAVDGTLELWLTDTSAKTNTSITYRLSGVENTDNGHKLTILLQK